MEKRLPRLNLGLFAAALCLTGTACSPTVDSTTAPFNSAPAPTNTESPPPSPLGTEANELSSEDGQPPTPAFAPFESIALEPRSQAELGLPARGPAYESPVVSSWDTAAAAESSELLVTVTPNQDLVEVFTPDGVLVGSVDFGVEVYAGPMAEQDRSIITASGGLDLYWILDTSTGETIRFRSNTWNNAPATPDGLGRVHPSKNGEIPALLVLPTAMAVHTVPAALGGYPVFSQATQQVASITDTEHGEQAFSLFQVPTGEETLYFEPGSGWLFDSLENAISPKGDQLAVSLFRRRDEGGLQHGTVFIDLNARTATTSIIDGPRFTGWTDDGVWLGESDDSWFLYELTGQKVTELATLGSIDGDPFAFTPGSDWMLFQTTDFSGEVVNLSSPDDTTRVEWDFRTDGSSLVDRNGTGPESVWFTALIAEGRLGVARFDTETGDIYDYSTLGVPGGDGVSWGEEIYLGPDDALYIRYTDAGQATMWRLDPDGTASVFATAHYALWSPSGNWSASISDRTVTVSDPTGQPMNTIADKRSFAWIESNTPD